MNSLLADFEQKIKNLKIKGDWRQIEKLLREHEKNLNHDHFYLWIQSLIKTSCFIRAECLLNSETLSGEKNKKQYLMIKYDLSFARRNFPDAAKIAQALLAINADDLDSKIRLAKALLANNQLSPANKIALEIKNKWPENKQVNLLIEDIESKKCNYELIEKRNKSIARKFFSADFFDLAPIQGKGCTVVVPCYNVEKFVGRTIQSILDCGHPELEILLVEDCSTDGTLSIIKEYQSKNNKIIKIIQHRKNSGLAAARNTGLAAANMPYVTFIDSDDLMIKGGVSRRVNSIHLARLKDDRFIGSYGGSVTIDEEAILPPASKPAQGMKIVDYLNADGLCPFNANQPLFITEFLRLSGGFPESEITAEDWPFWLLLLRMGGKITPTHTTDVTYRMRQNSMIRVTAEKHLENSYKILQSIQEEKKLLYSKPYHIYSIQQKFIERYFNFFGLRLASSFEKHKSPSLVSKELSGEFLNDLKTYLPDLHLINYDVKYIKSKIIQGVNRYYCVASVDQLNCAKVLKDMARGFAVGANSYALNNLATERRLSFVNQLEKIDVVFLPHKEYHARSAELIGNQLAQFGLNWRIVDFSCQYGDEGVSRYLGNSQAPALTINRLNLGLYSVSVAVVFNDWDPTVRSILNTLKAQGSRTVGIVEGVNDYLSIDTGVWRPAYRYVDTLFVPGEFHRKYFEGHNSIYVTGVQRLDPLVSKSKKCKPTSVRKMTCVINCNFTYGVLVEHRIFFLKSICDVLLNLGITPIISRHPQDVGDIGDYQKYVTQKSMYELLEETKIFITRFSGAVYEALLSGAHVVYFNPRIERWDMFFDPCGSYNYIESPEELRDVIQKIISTDFSLEKSQDFLLKHCDIKGDSISSSRKTAIALNEVIKNKENHVQEKIIEEPVYFFDLMKKVHGCIEEKEYGAACDILKNAIKSNVAKTNTQRQILLIEGKRLNRLIGNEEFVITSTHKTVASSCKNLFLIFSCFKYSERINILRHYYNKSLEAGDRYVFVIGGAEADYLDGDVLHLKCGDSYEKLPEKVFSSFRYACQNFDFERIVKIDDDIFVNFKNFYKVVAPGFGFNYYGRKNPPNFGHPLNRKWHDGKVSKGHRYDGKEFPLVEPAQWCSGGCYIVSKDAADRILSFNDIDFVENHVFEDYMIFDILSSFDIYPSFHENTNLRDLVWMEPTLDKVVDKSFSFLNENFDIDNVITIHCGPTNKYKVESGDLKRIFEILDRNVSRTLLI